uniref:Uncharacterized protein n=1 Tax=uncultured prokaryote TaxID=198431 RepID=A0A0H5QNQ2_9ZZZZ|nr:hypothetical protein [uncultured prokaryote]
MRHHHWPKEAAPKAGFKEPVQVRKRSRQNITPTPQKPKGFLFGLAVLFMGGLFLLVFLPLIIGGMS